MPLDGVALSGVIFELNRVLSDGRIDKIVQPEPDELIIAIRAHGENRKLLLTANAQAPRICLVSESKPGPAQAPMFCMVLRKHLSGGKLIKIVQPDFERIAELYIEARDEMGDRAVKKLVIEIMGKHSNIILLDGDGVITDAARHISHNTSSVREVLPGRIYKKPPSGEKVSFADISETEFAGKLSAQPTAKTQQAVYQSFNGISPVMASEWCLAAGVSPDTPVSELDEADKANLYNRISDAFHTIESGNHEFSVYSDEHGKPIDFSALSLSHVYGGCHVKRCEEISPMLEEFYRRKDTVYRMGQKTADLRKLVNTHIERCVKKQAVYDKTLNEIKNRDKLRVFGELLTANLYRIPRGAESCSLENFHDCDNLVEINLDASKTAAENAQSYFKKYNKQKRTFTALQDQIRQNTEDLNYLDTVINGIQYATDETDIAEIRAELAALGFVKKVSLKKARAESGQKKSKPLRFVSADGFEMFVGKNNTQNDELTLRFAQGGDIWLHTKDIAGSHVIIKTGGAEVPEQTITEAANLAAYHSKARDGSQVPVDFALRKHVRKPNGAKPGFVIYDHNKTVYVTPKEPGVV